jgi:hypothetical protein
MSSSRDDLNSLLNNNIQRQSSSSSNNLIDLTEDNDIKEIKKKRTYKKKQNNIQEEKKDEHDSKSVQKNYSEWGIDIPLYIHQQNSIINMEKLENNREFLTSSPNGNKCLVETNVGILGDRTGSGKTLCVASLLSRDKKKQNLLKSFKNNQEEQDTKSLEKKEDFESMKTKFITNHELNMKPIINEEKNEYSKIYRYVQMNNPYFSKVVYHYQNFFYIPLNIIVVLPSVFNQWKNELSHTNLKVHYIYKDKNISEFDKSYDVILITYNRFNQFVSHLNLLQNNDKTLYVKRVIFDEITYDMVLKKLDADIVWIITASNWIMNGYTERQLRSSFLKNLINSIDARLITIKNSDEIIEQSYRLPRIFEHIYECYSYYDNFSHLISDEARQMLAADDLASAIALLGGLQTNNNNLKDVIIQKEKDNLHRLEARLKYYEDMNDEKQIISYKDKIETQIKNLQNLENRIQTMNEDCPICMEKIEKKVIVGCCTNSFCNECILNIMKTNPKCPLCRSTLDCSKMLYADDNITETKTIEKKEENEDNNKSMSLEENTMNIVKNNKLKQLTNILKAKPNGKFIIFSQYNNTFYHIIEELKNSNISFCELKGSVDRINSILKQFDENKISVLFLNSKYNGTGINLQSCTDIIFYHKMTAFIEQQNIGRAMRIGRKIPLHIHRLTTRSETVYQNYN